MTSYKCDKCGTIFENSSDIIEHYESNQYARNRCNFITFCFTCHTQYTNKSEFDFHIENSVICEFYNPIAFKKMKKSEREPWYINFVYVIIFITKNTYDFIKKYTRSHFYCVLL